MTDGRGAPVALHLFLVWATATATVPVLGFGLFLTGWTAGTGAALFVLVWAVPLLVGVLTLVGGSARTLVPLCGSVRGRLGWAALVFVLGTLGVLAGLSVYAEGVGLGSATARIALTGVPYAVAAAFFVPGRWVRLGAVAVLAAAVGYGGLLGPAQADQERRTARTARYREHPELLYLGAPPPGMRVADARVGAAFFTVSYRAVREGYDPAYAGLTVRAADTPALRCPEPARKTVTCTVDAHGERRTVERIPGGVRAVTLTRRRGGTEVEVSSQSLDESGLRHVLDTLHPLSDTELAELMRDKAIIEAY
ncbi:hypothetical protein QZN11_15005 [Streptomyces gramineus]|uniref:hypothetical protein n=1 Tax=Streptomyces gramineus TaxID=910542 RepID=UPI00398B813C